MQRLFHGLLICATVILANGAKFPADGPSFKSSEQIMLVMKTVETNAELAFNEKGNSHAYTVEFESEVRVPPDLDVVCITETVVATEVKNGKKSLLLPDKRSSEIPASNYSFNAVINDRAETELDRIGISENPYSISKMVIRVGAVMATRRVETTIPADVKEDMTDVGQGIKLRLSSMKIGADRAAEVEIDWVRSEVESGAFLESVQAFDAKGKLLGGGRWNNRNQIFATSGKFEAEFTIPPNSSIANIKCVIVTKYKLKPIEFTIDKIFQM